MTKIGFLECFLEVFEDFGRKKVAKIGRVFFAHFGGIRAVCGEPVGPRGVAHRVVKGPRRLKRPSRKQTGVWRSYFGVPNLSGAELRRAVTIIRSALKFEIFPSTHEKKLPSHY